MAMDTQGQQSPTAVLLDWLLRNRLHMRGARCLRQLLDAGQRAQDPLRTGSLLPSVRTRQEVQCQTMLALVPHGSSDQAHC